MQTTYYVPQPYQDKLKKLADRKGLTQAALLRKLIDIGIVLEKGVKVKHPGMTKVAEVLEW